MKVQQDCQEKALTGWFGDDAYQAWKDAAKMLLDVCDGDEELAMQVLGAMQEKRGREKKCVMHAKTPIAT